MTDELKRTGLELVREIRPLRVGKRAPVMVEMEFYRSRRTGEETFTPDQMDSALGMAGAQIRAKEGLLQPGEIRAIREDLGLSQAEFEKLLGVGPKTVVRWERGTVFQNQSTNALLQLVRAEHNNAVLLADMHNVGLGV